MNTKRNFIKPTNEIDAFVLALFAVSLFYGSLIVFFMYGLGNPVHRIYILLGGVWPTGIIQFTTFLAFFWSMIMLGSKQRKIKWESQALELKILPEDEHKVLLPEQINNLRLSLIQNSDWVNSIYYKTLSRACTKFRSNQSPQETLDVVKVQSDMEMVNQDSSYGMIRYLAWAIPSIGFIGTVFGIGGALANAEDAMIGDLSRITSLLGTAFDTTLVSLFLSIILMFQLHRVQQNEESLIISIEEYIIVNFVNRIYVPKKDRK
jgi:biopolymer transport protein ExbB/TolQ